MRTFPLTSLALTALLLAACEGKKPAQQPVSPKDAAAVVVADPVVVADAGASAFDAAWVNPNAGNGEPAPRRTQAAYLAREAALPTRTPCKATCDEQHMSPAANACYRRAEENSDMAGTANITLRGESTPSGTCDAKSVVIDCCPALDPKNLKGIALRLGWAKATVEERKAIAWVIARVVIGGPMIDEDSEQREDFVGSPRATVENGGIVLDYWTAPEGGSPVMQHRKVTLRADGTTTVSPVVTRW